MTTLSAELIVDSSKIISNISRLKSLISSESKFMFIVKSNAYGHGLKEIVRKLESYVDAFGVVRMEEAILVRKATSKPILLMQGIYTESEIKTAKENNIQVVIHKMSQFELIGKNDSELGLWIKINTGMNRLGLSQEELKLVYKKGIIGSDSVLMTHMACGDDPDDPMNKMQIITLKKLLTWLRGKRKEVFAIAHA